MNKASGDDGIPVDVFQILKDDAVKVRHSVCQQIWKTKQWQQDWKGQFSFQRKARLKNAHNQYHTIVLISHASKVMLALKKFSKPGFNNM